MRLISPSRLAHTYNKGQVRPGPCLFVKVALSQRPNGTKLSRAAEGGVGWSEWLGRLCVGVCLTIRIRANPSVQSGSRGGWPPHRSPDRRVPHKQCRR